jgi:thiamine biosynthesis lipoprotein
MGTTWSLKFDNPEMLSLEAVRACVQLALDRVVTQMSTWDADSDISRYNSAPPLSRHTLEPEFSEVVECALHWASASKGAIDPTIGPLVAAWGFGAHADSGATHPSQAELASARARVGWQRLAFDRAARSLVQPGNVSLDLSGIAKGFAVDHATAALQTLGLSHFLVEVGGELRGVGCRPGGQPWQVQIESASGEAVRVRLADMAVATSGDRWHVREHGGRRWSHTIDPRSGEAAVNTIASVSVLHERCMHADALATVLAVLGPDDGLDFAQHHALAAVLIYRHDAQYRMLVSNGWSKHAA